MAKRKQKLEQLDFWPERMTPAMVHLASISFVAPPGASASARSFEDGRARAGGALGNPALNPDSFSPPNQDSRVFAPVNPDTFRGRNA